MAFETISVGYFEGPAPKTVIHYITGKDLVEDDEDEIIESIHQYRPIPGCCLEIRFTETNQTESREYSELGKNELASLFKEEDEREGKKYSEIKREDIEKLCRYFE